MPVAADLTVAWAFAVAVLFFAELKGASQASRARSHPGSARGAVGGDQRDRDVDRQAPHNRPTGRGAARPVVAHDAASNCGAAHCARKSGEGTPSSAAYLGRNGIGHAPS